MSPKRKRWLNIAIGFVLIGCVAAAVVIPSARFQIAYHDWQMRRAYNSCFRPSRFTSKMRAAVGEDSCERFKYHLRELELLGTVDQLKFQLQHIREDSRAADHFRDLVYRAQCPVSIHWEFQSATHSEPVELIVWCYAEEAESWNRFITVHDVPDVGTRFMDAGKSPPVGQ